MQQHQANECVMCALALCLSGAAIRAVSGAEEVVVEYASLAVSFLAVALLLLLVMKRMSALPGQRAAGATVTGIQLAVLALAALQTVSMVMLSRGDRVERYNHVAEKVERLTGWVSFMLIQIPAAYLLTMLMRYGIKLQGYSFSPMALLASPDGEAGGAGAAAGAVLAEATKRLAEGEGGELLAERISELTGVVRAALESEGGVGGALARVALPLLASFLDE